MTKFVVYMIYMCEINFCFINKQYTHHKILMSYILNQHEFGP